VTSAGRTLGQTLRAAREAKRWDLARAERETRIRTRYLVALERGDYRDLPDPVYTRGFVRNYALALGLEPERCLSLYRHETAFEETPRPVLTTPKPMRVRRGSTILTTGRVVTAGLAVLVVALVAYVGYQFLTFAGTPPLTITDPPTDVPVYEGTAYVLRGQTVPDARLEVDGLRENPSATADADGRFSIRVELVFGSNLITVVATDPVTGRTSDPVSRTITVAFPLDTPGPTAGSGSASPLPSATPTAP
jgi:cytoskeletal protein RodZ